MDVNYYDRMYDIFHSHMLIQAQNAKQFEDVNAWVNAYGAEMDMRVLYRLIRAYSRACTKHILNL